jgi:hypothetical protein
VTFFRNAILPILAATVWISVSEFVRNQLLLEAYWVEHYQDLGLVFPSDPVNGAVWGLWSLLFAIAVFIMSRRFSLLETTLLAWFVGFVLMWVVLWNMDVLPVGILLFAVPLSLLEAFVAALIVDKLAPG